MTDQTYKDFWKWFQQQEERLFYYEAYEKELLPQVLNELQKVNKDLVFEIGPEMEGQREFVVSANGMKSAFSDVIELVKYAPDLDRWHIIPFRQRKDVSELEVQLDDLILTPNDISFSYQKEKGRINLSLYVEDMDDEDEKMYHMVFLILDNIIGEYDVEMKIGSIDIYSDGDLAEDEQLFPLTKLPHIIDSLSSNSTVH
ncbi:hypothetical protein IPM65_00260 [Candidatus Roizmanbacteria bacterium]|nr:MAG: hypothetical protein IPM65_00260 [Candidatus Roizmanbacteria bacterium]